MMKLRINRNGLSKFIVAGALILGVGPVSIGGASAPIANLNLTRLTMSRSVNAGAVMFGSVTVSSAVPATRAVALTSSNPQVVFVQATAIIPPNSVQSIPFQVRGVGAGCATVVARQGNSSREHHLVVHPAPTGASFTLNVPDQNIPAAGAGIAARATVLNAGSPLSGVVRLSSSDSIAVAVPSTAPIVRTQAAFSLWARNTACVTITATIGSQSVKKTVQSVHIGG